MKRAVTLFFLLLSFFLISATCSRKSKPKKFGFPEVLVPFGLGVNIHFQGAPERDMGLIEEAGIKFIRADLTWTQVERKRGVYEFSRYDQLVEAVESRGGRILFILDYKNRLYGDEKSMKTNAQREGFARFAQEAAQRYQGKGIVWEIWNEPNIKRFWGDDPNVDDYMALVRVTCNAIRQADEDALIIAPSVCGYDGDFIRRCAEEGLFALVDGVSLHPYRDGGPESVLKTYEILRNMIDKYTPQGSHKPRIVSSEWGWGLSFMTKEIDGAVDAQMRQAAYLTRRFCVEAYAGIACAIHYKWRENNHGLIRNNFTPKPSYTAFKVINEQLTGFASSITRLEIGNPETVYIFTFEGPSGKKMVAWHTQGSEPVAIPFKGKEARGVDFLGNPVRFEVEDGILEFTTSEKPLFIEMEE